MVKQISFGFTRPKAQRTKRPTETRVIIEHRAPLLGQDATAAPGNAANWSNSYRTFEALSKSPDRTAINATAVGPMMLGGGGIWLPAPQINFFRNQLAAVSRYLYDNNGLVSYGVDQIADYSTPVIPKAATSDQEWNKLSDENFSRIAEIADFTGRLTFEGMQRNGSKAIDNDGDIGFIAVSENGFPQLQAIEGWRIGSLEKMELPGFMIVDGVVIDSKEAVKGYVVQCRDGAQIISANVMKLLYDPDHFSSYRGYSPIRRGSNDIRDHHDIKGFEKKAAKINSALAAVLEGGVIEEDDWGNGSGSPDNPGSAPKNGLNPDGTVATQHDKKIAWADLMGGDIPVLDPGQKLNLLDNKRASTAVTEFLSELAGYFIAGLGLPAAFFLDTKLTGPNVRSVIGKAQRKFTNRIKTMARLAKWYYILVTADAINKGILPPNPEWEKVSFQIPAKLTIDLGDQASNDRQDVESGQMSRKERYGNRALEWHAETDQINIEIDYIIQKAIELQKKHQATAAIPIEIILAAHGLGLKTAAPASPPGESSTTSQSPGEENQPGKNQQQPPKKTEKK